MPAAGPCRLVAACFAGREGCQSTLPHACFPLLRPFTNPPLTPHPPGLRIGLYSPVKTALGADEPGTGVHRKIAAGMLSGAVAAAACNPTDLVKTRMQTAGARQGVAQVVRCVVAAEGWAGLWRGTTPSMVSRRMRGASAVLTS